MIKRFFFLPVFFILLLFISCRKEEKNGNGPSLTLKCATGYVSGDTILAPGAQVKLGLTVLSGDVNVTNVILKINSGTEMVYADTGINNKELYFEKLLTKSASPKDIWTIIVRDKAGRSASYSFQILKDPYALFGPVKNFSAVTLGAQNNSSSGSFFNLNNGQIYFLNEAFTVQDSIEMLYYFDPSGDGNTLASPNANIDSAIAFGGPSGLSHWNVKNETRYYKTTLTSTDFNNAINDSLLLSSYNELLGKRKAKLLVPGDIYAFKTTHSKYGLFRVNAVNGTDAGTLVVDIKIQP